MQDIKETSSYRIALRDKILDMAMSSFMQHGIRAVKMDDIARQLSISKRTLYELYKDKEELLYQSIRKYDQQRAAYLVHYAAEGHHVIDVIIEAYRRRVKEAHMVNPLFYDDIMKYPKVEQYIMEAHEKTRRDFYDFMQQGVKEGLLRPDIDYTITPHLLDAIGEYVMNNQLRRRYSVEQLFANFFLVLLRGICTEQGVKTLDAAMAKIQ